MLFHPASKCILDFCERTITYSYICSASTWGSLNVFTQRINKISLGSLKVQQVHDISPWPNIEQQICQVLQHLLDRLLPKKNEINVRKFSSQFQLQLKNCARCQCSTTSTIFEGRFIGASHPMVRYWMLSNGSIIHSIRHYFSQSSENRSSS